MVHSERQLSQFGRLCIAGVICSVAASSQVLAEPAEQVQFNRDIRPILSDKCFHCHGPDSASREADLRLDDQTALLTVVEPNDAAASELIQRITHEDVEQRMPPSDSGRSLSPKEIKLLTRWVQQGAAWQKHWSFITPVAPTLPGVKAKSWLRNPMDRFVLAKLEARSWKPSPQAEKEALIRRVTFDLTGLPPTLAEITRSWPMILHRPSNAWSIACCNLHTQTNHVARPSDVEVTPNGCD